MPQSPPATGPNTAAIFGLSRRISDSPSFRRLCEATDSADADSHIYRWGVWSGPSKIERARPCAAMWILDPRLSVNASAHDYTQYTAQIHVGLLLTAADTMVDNRNESGDAFAQWVDSVLTEALARGASFAAPFQELSTYNNRWDSPFRHSSDYKATASQAFWEAWFRLHT